MPNDATTSGNLRAALALAAVAASGAVALVRFEPPTARTVAPAAEFSAGRAFATLSFVLGDERPHPTGSDANREVRGRIEAALREVGVEPRVSRREGCSRGRCREVENVVATLAGTAGLPEAVLLACHHDSVRYGPGAGDDGAGVATLLEVARALASGPRPGRDVVLLFDDGEELGLLGADAFVKAEPEAKRIAAVINVEARGTGGPSLMFETKGVRLGAIRMLGAALARPSTSSLFGGVYERMPNDTDLTVFARAGWLGFNFAFLRGFDRYHTAEDDLAHLSKDSLQHHGDNVLALTRALADPSTPLRPAADEPRAVWFDVLSLGVVAWPEPWAVPLAGVGVLGLVVATASSARRGLRGLRSLAAGSLATLGAWLAAASGAAGFVEAWRAAGGGRVWSSHPHFGVRGGTPWPGLLAVAAIVTAATTWLAMRLRAREARDRHLAVWFPSAAAGVFVAGVFPPASHLFAVPVALAAVTALALRPLARRLPAFGAASCHLLPAVASGLLWWPVFAGLRDALGLDGHAALALALAVPLSTFAPELAEATPRAHRVALLLAAVTFSVALASAVKVLAGP